MSFGCSTLLVNKIKVSWALGSSSIRLSVKEDRQSLKNEVNRLLRNFGIV
jgi:hypothetical protein